MTSDTWLVLLRDYGLAVVLLIGVGWFTLNRLFPAILDYWKQINESQLARERQLQDELRVDKKLMLDAFLQNTRVQSELQATMAAFRVELAETRKEIDLVKTEVQQVYHIVAIEKKLIVKD